MRLTKISTRKSIRFLVGISLLLIIATISINCYVLHLADGSFHKPEYYTSADKVDAIIVLGAAMYDSGPSLMLRDRLDAAIALYESGISNRILVSGDHGQTDYNEVQGMRDYLLDAGIPVEHIFMDHAGFDTYSTMYRARDVFLVESAIISTQEFHLSRAVYLAQRLGLDAQGVICDQRSYLFMGRNKARESLARVKAWLQVELLHSEPQYLGDTIDIHGSGLQTHD